jgi:choice-of-anchor A domain-containing protein
MLSPFTPRRGWSGSSLIFAVSAFFASLSCVGNIRAGGISWTQFDAVTLNDFSSPSDVEGWTLVGGNVTGSTWNGSIHQNTPATTPTVIVGGTFSGQLNLQYGSLLISSSSDVLGHVNYNGGAGAGPIFDTTRVSTEVSTISSQLRAVTAAYAGLTANNTVTIQGGNTAVFNASSANANGVAVFSVAASALAGLTQFQLGNVGAGVNSIIINVSGSGTFSESANFIGNWGNFESKTLWNFDPSFTAIETGAAWDGALMALGATLTNSNDQNGAVFVNNLTAMSEIHLPIFDGVVPTSVPEPSTITLLCIPLFVGLAASFRNRANRCRPVVTERRDRSHLA